MVTQAQRKVDDMLDLELMGKNVAVAGGTSGIGLGVAKGFLKQGARVVICSERTEQEVADVLTELSHLGEVHYVQANFAELQNAQRFVSDAFRILGDLDILILNAGICRCVPFQDVTPEILQLHLTVNYISHFFAVQQFRKLAGDRRGKSQAVVAFTTSINAVLGEEDHTPYDPTKAALSALIRGLIIELTHLNYRIFGIAPGLIATPLTDNGLESDAESRTRVEAAIPAGRIGTVDELVEFYLFICSVHGRYFSSEILVDGGLAVSQRTAKFPLTASS